MGGLLIVYVPGGLTSSAWRSDPRAGLIGVALLAGPSVAGILLTGLVSGRTGYRELLARLVRWRVGLGWYAVALQTAPVLAAATNLSGSSPGLRCCGPSLEWSSWPVAGSSSRAPSGSEWPGPAIPSTPPAASATTRRSRLLGLVLRQEGLGSWTEPLRTGASALSDALAVDQDMNHKVQTQDGLEHEGARKGGTQPAWPVSSNPSPGTRLPKTGACRITPQAGPHRCRSRVCSAPRNRNASKKPLLSTLLIKR
jgi:hypothetical protein